MSEAKPVELPITQTGPIVPRYGEDMSKPRQEGGRPAVNEKQTVSADRQRYNLYLEKIANAKEAGVDNMTEQLSYEEINDFSSLKAKFSK